MPRQARIDISGLLYHIMLRGVERREIFAWKEDKEDFLKRLEISLEGSGAKVFAWALMPNHAHILIRTGKWKLSRIMRGLLSGYATKFNVRHKRVGYLFQNRYKAIIVEEEEYLLELIRYIHLNPIRAKIACDMEVLDGYGWSGHSVIMGKRKQCWQEVDEVLERFGSKVSAAREKYREFVKDGIELGKQKQFSGGGLIRSAGGLLEVLRNRKSGIMEEFDDRILGSGDFVSSIQKELDKKEGLVRKAKKNLDMNGLIKRIEKKYKVSLKQMKGKARRREISRARRVLSYMAMEYLGINGRQVGAVINKSTGGISQLYRQGEKVLEGDPVLLQEILN